MTRRLRHQGRFLRTGNTYLRERQPGVTAPPIGTPPIITPPQDLAWDYATVDGGAKLQWPLTNNQFDNMAARLPDGRYRDWNATLNGPQHRYGGVRYYYSWWHTVYEWVPGWQPAARLVYRVYRKGSSGQALRTLVFECIHNTATIPLGDQVWFYLAGTSYEGEINTASTYDIGGYTLNLKQKMTVTGGSGSPDNPVDSRSFVEVTFGQDLPPINHTVPLNSPVGGGVSPRPALILNHHSFYANAATRQLRYPFAWHFNILRNDVIPNGGHVVLGGAQGNPTWRDWTDLFNFIGPLAYEMYALEQQGLAQEFGAIDPRRVLNELENESVREYLPSPGNPMGFRAALLDIMYPHARAAWGNTASFLVKPNQHGSLDGLWDWDVTNGMLGNGNNFLGNHNYADSTPHQNSPTGRQLWYEDAADCQWHATRLSSVASTQGYKGAVVTEFSAPRAWAVDVRGKSIGRFHTYMTGRSIPVALWDLTGDQYGCAWLYDDVPGTEGKVVQAIIPELRPYCGRSGRSV